MVQNSLGRKWLATYPESKIRDKMEYYIEPAEQTPEVQAKLAEITPNSLDPEKITLMDPACGSGHILVEAYDIFKEIYLERGYRTRDIPKLILEKNLYGLDIDDRAAQLAGFALLMRARKDDSRVLSQPPRLNVMSIQDTEGINASDLVNHLCEFDSELDRSAIVELISLFKLGKTVGSLTRIPDKIVSKLSSIKEITQSGIKSSNLFVHEDAETLEPIIEQAILLSKKYDCVVANPPYMGTSYFEFELKSFVNKEYKFGSSDLYGCFIHRNTDLSKPNGLIGMITIPNWMFLSSFEKLRQQTIDNQVVESMVHNGRGVFGSDFGTCCFILRKIAIPDYVGSFRRLFEKQGSVSSIEELQSRFFSCRTYYSSNGNFHKIPGSPIAYWASKRFLEVFEKSTPLGEIAEPRQGLATSDNNRFLRLWHEVDISKVFFNCPDATVAKDSQKKWFPYNKGGEFRKWYGNNDYLINWENDGEEVIGYAAKLYGSPTRTIKNISLYFKPGITWTMLSSSFFGVRYKDMGFVFDIRGSSCFPVQDYLLTVLGFMCSGITSECLKILSPTISFEVGHIASLPTLKEKFVVIQHKMDNLLSDAVEIARHDWDSLENSWNFMTFPWIDSPLKLNTTEQSFINWENHLNTQIKRMMELETENNRLWINAYGLQDELNPEVPEDQITLARPDAEKDIKRLISYSIGCIIGRYSLDEPGLIYANSGNIGFDSSRYKTFLADDDGILPISDIEWFPDDVTIRFFEFIKTVWSTDTLEENLKFISESLTGKQVTDSREVIRKYISSNFFKDHLQTYKNRPIYWLFSSGKQKAFECLVYLHRYNEATLSRMRSEYVIPLQGKINGRIQWLEKELGSGSKGSEVKVRKELETLKKKQTELISFDDNLRHYADMKISLDLDDGVKVNYGKFNGLLAEVAKVTGRK